MLRLLARHAGRLGRGRVARPWPVPHASPEADDVPRIYHKGRNFRIPFNLNPEGRDRVKELHLLVSEDQGYHWRRAARRFPTIRPSRSGRRTTANTGSLSRRARSTARSRPHWTRRSSRT